MQRENLRIKNFEWRNASTRIIRAGVGFLLVLTVCAWAFDYKLAKGDVNDLSFYTLAPQNVTFRHTSGRDVRNVILCIGDGMGTNQMALARHRIAGPDGRLWIETLPVAGLVRTFSADSVVTDSSAAATAMACGVKTDNGVLGIGADKQTCVSILEILSKKGWRTGLLATSAITHATPAGFASHVSSRGSEEDIADQLLNNRVDILLGGGRKFWLPEDIGGGVRKDGRNLIEAAQRMGYTVIQSRQEMLDLTYGPVLGLFEDGPMTTLAPEPSLAEMTQKAIQLLSTKNTDWFAPEAKFFMMVEGSQIDWAGHDNDTANSIRQTLLFDMAVKEALDYAREDGQTLVIVTADHETGGLVLNKKNDREIDANWTTKKHTGCEVPLFAYGPGSQEFAGVMDNTDIPKKIAKLIKLSPFPQTMKSAGEKELPQKLQR